MNVYVRMILSVRASEIKMKEGREGESGRKDSKNKKESQKRGHKCGAFCLSKKN
jgi:hypothetical protein